MSRVNLMLGGRDYAVACAPGEEEHVLALGQLIDEKIDELPEASAQNETRTLLFAALLLADEVYELRANPPAASAPASDDRLNAIAERLERIAAAVEAIR